MATIELGRVHCDVLSQPNEPFELDTIEFMRQEQLEMEKEREQLEQVE
eukprot:CAMPEP_0202693430 /NCGR_PEP_ID=MMETSP1385-20130828/7553_1 /ASSEMBLY_ACC=CAM_ASM_000861 /TAXON_ID=933848 /ORGANISM="Elphidium margaritaceum" /LENGTH=47 /DNA_ID= /DNA_START= /DNA_END= /DNA_ORIENTATION=